jgi:hypothetical protein
MVCTKLFRTIALLAVLLGLAPAALAQLVSQGNEQVVTYSPPTASVLVNSPVNPNLLVNTGTNTFILGVNPPTNAARIYITNDTVNACNNLTVSMASTGNNALNSFNANPQAWQSILVQSGSAAFGASAALTLPASGTVAVTSQPIIGSKIALFVVLSAGCATTNIDMQVVFGTFSPGLSAVTGVTPPGGNASGTAPVLIGGIDLGGLARSVNVIVDPSGGLQGIPIGGQGAGPGGTYANVRLPGNATDGPLAIYLYGETQSASTAPVNLASGVCSSTANCSGIYAADPGFLNITTTPGITTSGQTVTFYLTPQGGVTHSTAETCQFATTIVNNAGTTPTLDVFIQDSLDGSNWDDRIHFNQATTGTSRQAAGIAGTSANETVHAYTNHTIAAGTIVSGPIGPFLQAEFQVTGTTPSYTVTLAAYCK